MNAKRFKVILALAAVLAVSGIATASASAGAFNAEKYPATISGAQTTQVVFGGVVGKWACKSLNMSGTMTASSVGLDLTPVYSECSWAGIPATTNMEGCTYEFTAGETVEKDENKVQGTMDIKCPEGKEVKLVLNGGTCTIFIPAQTNLGSVTAETTTAASPKDVDLTLALTGIKYKVVNGGLGCPGSPGSGNYTNGTLDGKVTLKAEAGGNPIPFWVS